MTRHLTQGAVARAGEAARCVHDLHAPHFGHEVVRQSLEMAFGSDARRAPLMRLLAQLAGSGGISATQIRAGFERIRYDMGRREEGWGRKLPRLAEHEAVSGRQWHALFLRLLAQLAGGGGSLNTTQIRAGFERVRYSEGCEGRSLGPRLGLTAVPGSVLLGSASSMAAACAARRPRACWRTWRGAAASAPINRNWKASVMYQTCGVHA
jgi:hypothetical protein